MKKMKEFKSICFVFLKFPVSNLFSASDLGFRISTDPLANSSFPLSCVRVESRFPLRPARFWTMGNPVFSLSSCVRVGGYFLLRPAEMPHFCEDERKGPSQKLVSRMGRSFQIQGRNPGRSPFMNFMIFVVKLNPVYLVKKNVKICVNQCQRIPVKKSALICVICGFILSSFGSFHTRLVPVLALFVHVSIGISPYVFVPQTSFLNQYHGFSPFSGFLNFVFSHLPGVQPHQNGMKTGTTCPAGTASQSQRAVSYSS